MALVGMLLAVLIGLSLGILGGGGSILTVPIFVYVLGMAAKPAIGMSLAVVGSTSLAGAFGHWREGNLNPRLALLFGAVAMVGSFIGARLSAFVAGNVQLILFAVIMLVAAVFMARGRRGGTTEGQIAPAWLPLGAAGLGVGLLTGLVGVGGGFLIVPALVLLAGVSMKQAVGTSLLVIAMNSASAFIGYLNQVAIDWLTIILFSAIAIAGSLVGARLVRYVSQAALRRAFAVFLVGMSLFILYQNRGIFLG